jgi:hypothetical protein
MVRYEAAEARVGRWPLLSFEEARRHRRAPEQMLVKAFVARRRRAFQWLAGLNPAVINGLRLSSF